MLSAKNLFEFKGEIPWQHWALDSGAFSILKRHGHYTFSPDDYLKLLDRLNPIWAASMDYPCEPIIRSSSNMSVQEHITATIELAKYLCSRDDRIVPVVQGIALEEYESCWKRLPKTGKIAIGSVCRRQSLSEIDDLIRGMKEFIPLGWIHGFGVKISALKRKESRGFFSSIDTTAWQYETMIKRYQQRGMRWRDRLHWAYLLYGEKISALKREILYTMRDGKTSFPEEAKKWGRSTG